MAIIARTAVITMYLIKCYTLGKVLIILKLKMRMKFVQLSITNAIISSKKNILFFLVVYKSETNTLIVFQHDEFHTLLFNFSKTVTFFI